MRSSPAQKPAAWTVRRPTLERAMVFGGLLLAVALAGAIGLPVLPRPAYAAAAVLPTDTSVPTDPASVITPLPTAAAKPTLVPSPTAVEPSATPLSEATAPIATPSAEPTAEATAFPTATPSATEPAKLPTATPSEPTGITQPPTETPAPTATPTVTPNAGEPPLVLTKRASHPQVAPGATFNYLLRVETTSAAPLSVRVRDQLDPQVQAVGAAASSGSCLLGAVVQCSLRVARDTPATLQISVQVRSDVAPGLVVVSQATARDEANNAASSEPVAVAVIELSSSGSVAPTPSGTPLPPRVAATPDPTTSPAPSGRITGTVIELSSGAPAEGIAVRVGDSIVRTDSAGNYQRAGLPQGVYEVALALEPGQGQQAQEALRLALGPGETVVQHLSFTRAALAAIPPTARPTAAASASPAAAPAHGAGSALPRRVDPPARTGVSLPATAGIPAVAALVVGLLGLGLTVRALRRTRAAGALLADQSRLVGELAPLLRAALRRQRAADSALLAMRRQSEHIAELLDKARKK
ncbi:MAG TPA: hypothetical protein VFS21_27750 [Roseiflexaceae bacterium]|nr:hypothetical protein [Roseiflexaceae bacterium]